MSRPRRTDLPETDWATSALCADMPAEIFDAAGDRVQTAKAACAHCPVARQWVAQNQWFAWRLRHDLTDRLPESFQDVLDAVTAFADPVLTTTLTVADWDPATRAWSTAAGTS